MNAAIIRLEEEVASDQKWPPYWSFWERYRRPIRQSMREILSDVARVNFITVEDLKSRAKDRRVSYPRQEFMYLARLAQYSTTQIGRMIGRDHSSVVHGANAHRRRIEKAALA